MGETSPDGPDTFQDLIDTTNAFFSTEETHAFVDAVTLTSLEGRLAGLQHAEATTAEANALYRDARSLRDTPPGLSDEGRRRATAVMRGVDAFFASRQADQETP